MRSATLWWRACGSARRQGKPGLALRCRRSLEAVTNPFHDVRPQRQQLQQARSWSWKASALAENGPAAGVIPLYPRSSQQSRFISSAASSLDVAVQGDDGLLHVLRCEVEDLTKNSLNIAPRKPPKPFTLVKDELGEMEMTLTRIYGLEDISISCVLQVVRKEYRRKPEIGEDPESRTKMLQLTIYITRGGTSSTLKIRCECYRDGFSIHQVDILGEDEDQSAYRPYFSDCKEELVNNFQIFLYERGLNADLAGYMEKHLERKRLIKSAGVMGQMSKFLELDSPWRVSAEG